MCMKTHDLLHALQIHPQFKASSFFVCQVTVILRFKIPSFFRDFFTFLHHVRSFRLILSSTGSFCPSWFACLVFAFFLTFLRVFSFFSFFFLIFVFFLLFCLFFYFCNFSALYRFPTGIPEFSYLFYPVCVLFQSSSLLFQFCLAISWYFSVATSLLSCHKLIPILPLSRVFSTSYLALLSPFSLSFFQSRLFIFVAEAMQFCSSLVPHVRWPKSTRKNTIETEYILTSTKLNAIHMHVAHTSCLAFQMK